MSAEAASRIVRSGSRCAESDQDRVGLVQRVVVRGRAEAARIDVRLQNLGGDVLDVALAPVELLDAVRLDVHEHDGVARVGEDLRERHTDVAGPDDGNRGHEGRSV
jgi:hypothetical protein